MIFDSHIHTKFSEDSEMNIEDVIKKSNERNIGVIITEHMDLDQPIGIGFRYDIDAYFNEYEKYRSNSTLLGTELGLALTTIKENKIIATTYPYDYIIGSIHSVYDKDIYSSFGKLDIPKDKKFHMYFDCMIECVQQCDFFDSLAHIDYLSRYVQYEHKEIDFNIYKEKLEIIFKTLIEKDKCLELNTARLSSKIALDNLYNIYSLYKELGGKYVTLGSDAHFSNDIFRNFNIGLDLIDSLDLKGIYFKNRKPEFF